MSYLLNIIFLVNYIIIKQGMGNLPVGYTFKMFLQMKGIKFYIIDKTIT